MTDKHPCAGYEVDLLTLNDPPNSCVGCVYLITRESDWEHPKFFECNRTRFDVPYQPSIKVCVPYPDIPKEKEQ